MGVNVAPGVYVREVDLSLYIPALSTTILGMVGRATKGPTNERTYVTNQQQFVDVFGQPDSAVGFESYAALQYLRRGRQLWFVRVVGPSAAKASKTFNREVAVADEVIVADVGIAPNASQAGTLANLPVVPGSIDEVSADFGPGPEDIAITDDGEGALSGTYTGAGGGSVAGTINYTTGDWTLVFDDDLANNSALDMNYDYYDAAFVAEALSEGEWGNLVSLSVEAGDEAGSFKLVVYSEETPVERFNNLDLDPVSANYVEMKVNGASDYVTIDVDAGAGPTDIPILVLTPTALAGGDSDAGNVAAADVVGLAWDPGLEQPTGLQLFASPNAVDINLLAAPGWSDAAVVNALIVICETRADCMAVVDPPEGLTAQEVVDWHNGQGTWAGSHAAFNSSYAALYWPWIKVYDAYNRQFVFTPPSGHVLAVYAYTDQSSETWFAPAGVIRGRVISGVDSEYDPTQGELELLYGDGNAVNPIERFPKDGLVVWGQRTLQRTPTALDRVNVRRLLLYLRKVISTSVRALVFEPNDEKTWLRFGHLTVPYLQNVTQRRGLYDFRVQCDETTNTPDVIDRNEMLARIFLQPVKAGEFLQIDLVVTPTGANFDEILF